MPATRPARNPPPRPSTAFLLPRDQATRRQHQSGCTAAADSEEPEPPSSQALEEEAQRADWNARVCAAKEVNIADPANAGNKLKYMRLAADYAEAYEGVFVPDIDVAAYIRKKTRKEFELDELRYRAVSTCPLTRGGPLDAYFAAAEAFERDFGHPLRYEDGHDGLLAKKREMRAHHKALVRLDDERIAQLAGRRQLSFVITNPFPAHDPRRRDFDLDVREHFASYMDNPNTLPPTVPRANLGITFTNPFYADPFSIECQERYCKHEMWRAELEAIEDQGKIQARTTALPHAVPTASFYGAVRDSLYNAKNTSRITKIKARKTKAPAHWSCCHIAMKLTPKARRQARNAAVASSSPAIYELQEGPAVPDPRRKVAPHVSRHPDVLLYNGQTLVQPRLPALLAQYGLVEARTDGRHQPPPSAEDLAAQDLADEAARDPDIMFVNTTPPPDKTKHRRKRAAQWHRWQNETLPALLPEYARMIQEMKSLRDLEGRKPQASPCACHKEIHRVAVVRFSAIEDFEIHSCKCAPVSVQLMRMSAFGCSPVKPSLAVDLRVLEFTFNLFLQISPNNTAITVALERVLGNMGFQLDHQNYTNEVSHQHSLRRRFGNCLMWYTHLRNLLKHDLQIKLEAVREAILRLDNTTSPSETDTPRPLHREMRIQLREDAPRSGPARRDVLAPPVLIRLGHRRPRLGTERSVCGRQHLNLWRCRSLNHRRCRVPPNTYAGAVPPASGTSSAIPQRSFNRADVMVSIDACFTQKKKKSPADPPKQHPDTHFVSEEQARRTEAYVDSVRDTSDKSQDRRKRVVREVDEDDHYEYERLPLPRSVYDACEASFKAADEKREKASTEFFEDTALMALLCRHDRVLWLGNMHSAGEKQFYVIALVETLFQHLPLAIRVGLLYNVGCSFERSCLKWGFLARFMDRIAFAVSVFHAFGHEWACQLLYHPRKRGGFGFTNGEGAERFWNSIRHLIAHLRICGYHNRLYTLDAQIEHTDEASLLCLGEWVARRYRHSVQKRAEATEELRKSGKSTVLLREQWELQVKPQTKPLPRRTKNRGQQAVNGVVLLRAAVKTREDEVDQLRKKFLVSVDTDDDAPLYQMELLAAEEALGKSRRNLQRKEAALGVTEHAELQTLVKSEHIRVRMNARALKFRVRERLRARKFELDIVECDADAKLHAHTESAVKRREPMIARLAGDYNKLCVELEKLIRNGKAPAGSIPPVQIPTKGLWQLDVDDAIFEDVGLDDPDDEEPPLWLRDEKVRAGIKAMLELDRCDEEDARLQREAIALREWFREEWNISTTAIEAAESDVEKYHLQLHQDKLVQLCVTWDKRLPNFGAPAESLPRWGPSQLQMSSCRADAHTAARGEDRHYGQEAGEESDDEGYNDVDGGESGGEDEEFETLEAVERADIYRTTA
ncbi:hypothetical protein K438DRAFT_1783790 [Mycena galopus ATCC 62051]|nr:hypothetical protein K438DRAFT_1783790 [Mycena galopus ATCC 62051]